MIKIDDLEQFLKTINKKQIFSQNTKPAIELDNIWIDTTNTPYNIYRCDGTDYIQIGSSSSGVGSSIDDTLVSDTTTYSSSKILSITGDINDTNLPIELQGKSIIEMLKANFSNANEAKSLIINAIGDVSLADTDTFEQISNCLISKKQEIVNALASKGIVANEYEDIINYATYINSIVQNSQLKKTKLNRTAGDITNVVLTNPTNIQGICTTVLEYQPGNTGVVQYDCDFNNSDASSFNITADQHLIFDGKMKQDNHSENITMTKIDNVGSYNCYTALIDKTKFNKISSITESKSSNDEIITVNSTYGPVLVQANRDIDLNNVENISNITWEATCSNASKLLLLYSIDSGITWKGYDSINKIVLNINDISDLSEVESKGISIDAINSFTQVDLDNIRNSSPKIRFAYYLKKDSTNDVVENDKIEMVVKMLGKDIFSKNYNISFDNDKTLTYTFTANGTYTIVYIDNN